MKSDLLISELATQFTYFLKSTPDTNEVPRSFSEADGLMLGSPQYWTCGFPPGSLWYMYELTGDEKWKDAATVNTLKLDEAKNRTNTHDLGFIIFCSYGNAFRITGIEDYKNVIIEASDTLIKRFNPAVGCLRSWDWGDWKFPVIIDNVMNLEMLFWVSKITGESKYRDVALRHADATMQNHYREDFTCCHVVDYDPESGQVIQKQTHQGLSDESAWARGLAWGFYGYVMCYRETKNEQYLDFAQKIAAYILDNAPDDMIPHWDYDVPQVSEEPRDASAGSLIASALYELSGYVPTKSEFYIRNADRILESLSSKNYRAEIGTNGGFLLLHSTGNKPGGSEIDSSINYADYYYLEALKRQIQIKNS